MNTREINPAATTANWYGDRGHHALLGVWPTADTPAFQWQKSGFVRGVLWCPEDALPVYYGPYAFAAELSDACGYKGLPKRTGCGYGTQRVDTATAIRIALSVRKDWRKHWRADAEHFAKSGAPITAELAREWTHHGPLMGVALAAFGRAWLWEGDGSRVRECSPEEAAAVSERPISPREYGERIDAAIASLRRLPH